MAGEPRAYEGHAAKPGVLRPAWAQDRGFIAGQQLRVSATADRNDGASSAKKPYEGWRRVANSVVDEIGSAVS